MAAVVRPRGPGGLAMLRAIAGRDGQALLDFFTSVAEEFPTVAHLRVPGEHVYVLSDPSLVREVVVHHGRHTVKSRGLQNARILVGDGLLTSEGEVHRRHRRLVQPAFRPGRMSSYAEAMLAEATALEQRWRDGDRVDLHEEMATLTLTIAGRTLFGVDLRDEADVVAAGLADALAVFRRTLLPGGRVLLALPLPSSRRARAAGDRLDQLVRQVMAQRAHEPSDRGDVLSSLLAARDNPASADSAVPGDPLPAQQVRDEVMTMLIAGHETTAVALSWTWWLLGNHPEADDAVHTELREVLGGRDVRPDDVARLPVTTAAVAEAIRLFPPAWVLGRRLTSPLVLDGWTVPAGSVCVASQWALHRDGRFWSEPAAYRPQRWLDSAGAFDESAPGQPRGSWFPFGMGARACIGEGFAWAETVLVLAVLARSWRLRPVVAGQPRVDPAVTLRPAGGLPMVLARS